MKIDPIRMMFIYLFAAVHFHFKYCLDEADQHKLRCYVTVPIEICIVLELVCSVIEIIMSILR